jgi:putative acetyltransferase
VTPAPATDRYDLRRVQAADVPAVVEVVRETLAEYGLTFGEGAATDAPLLALPASYEAEGGAFWVVTRPDGAVVGTCGVAPVEPGVFELRKMYLRPETRGTGVAQRLLETCVAWCRAQGGSRLVLDTIHEMTRAIRFYERNGFARDDTQVRGSRCSRGYARDL